MIEQLMSTGFFQEQVKGTELNFWTSNHATDVAVKKVELLQDLQMIMYIHCH